VLEAAKRRILSLTNFPGVPTHYTDEERQIYITSIMAFESICMVSRAAVAVNISSQYPCIFSQVIQHAYRG